MNFLSKLGRAVASVAGIVTGVGPLLKAYTPPAVDRRIDQATDTIGQIAGIVESIEAAGQVIGAPGEQKLQMAAPQVAQAILRSDVLAGRHIADPARFRAGAQQIASGMAEILNSLDENEARVENLD